MKPINDVSLEGFSASNDVTIFEKEYGNKELTDKEKRLSKYAACEYLNVSRATFDNYVREGKLPRSKHEIGFKELSWNKKTLDEFIRRSKHEK